MSWSNITPIWVLYMNEYEILLKKDLFSARKFAQENGIPEYVQQKLETEAGYSE